MQLKSINKLKATIALYTFIITFKLRIVCRAVQETLTFLHISDPVDLRISHPLHDQHVQHQLGQQNKPGHDAQLGRIEEQLRTIVYR